MRLKLLDGRRLGNNPKGNPNLYKAAEQWRFFTPNWKEYLTQISRERSTGPRTYWGKLKSSQNARKRFGAGGRFSKDSLFLHFLTSGGALLHATAFGHKEIAEKIEKLMEDLNLFKSIFTLFC